MWIIYIQRYSFQGYLNSKKMETWMSNNIVVPQYLQGIGSKTPEDKILQMLKSLM